MHTNEKRKNSNNVSSNRVTHFYMWLWKVPNMAYYFISNGVCDQISIALFFNIFAPEFERAFGDAIAEF